MTPEQSLREKLRKIEALFAGAGTEGEKVAAGKEKEIEVKFSISDVWSRQLFVALCRRYDLRPFRYRRMQILWVNMVTAVTLALALAFEPAEPDVMRRPPRDPGEAIHSGILIWRVVLVSTVFLGVLFGMFALARAQGASVEEARTIVVNTLVVLEILYLFSLRYLKSSSITWRGVVGTPAVLIAVGAVTALQLMFTYAPFMGLFFDTRPLSLAQGMQVAIGVAVLLILEAEKWIQSSITPRRRGPGVGSPAGGMRSALQSWRGR